MEKRSPPSIKWDRPPLWCSLTDLMLKLESDLFFYYIITQSELLSVISRHLNQSHRSNCKMYTVENAKFNRVVIQLLLFTNFRRFDDVSFTKNDSSRCNEATIFPRRQHGYAEIMQIIIEWYTRNMTCCCVKMSKFYDCVKRLYNIFSQWKMSLPWLLAQLSGFDEWNQSH